MIFSPHTTAGITINENADPNVVKDMLFGLKKTFSRPAGVPAYGRNTTAHLKASFVGSSATVLVENGGLALGTWQEFISVSLTARETAALCKSIGRRSSRRSAVLLNGGRDTMKRIAAAVLRKDGRILICRRGARRQLPGLLGISRREKSNRGDRGGLRGPGVPGGAWGNGAAPWASGGALLRLS